MFVALFVVGIGNIHNVYSLFAAAADSPFYGAIAAVSICLGAFSISLYDYNQPTNNRLTTITLAVVLIVEFLATTLHIYSNMQPQITTDTQKVFGVSKVAVSFVFGLLYPVFSCLISLILKTKK